MKKHIVSIFIFMIVFLFCGNPVSAAEITEESTRTTNGDYVYLSDIPYMEEESFANGSHSIHFDENDDNGILTLKENDTEISFIKGLCAWADSQIVYDLSEYSYDYFTSYLGIDISEQNDYFNTGVIFYIYTSVDGEHWEEQYRSDVLYGWSDAEFAKIEIKNAKYLKLAADDASDGYWAAWYDEAVFADAKLITENYVEDTTTVDFIKTVVDYDEIIKNHVSYEITGEYEAALLQREFVNNVGYDILQALARYKTEYKDTIQWLMTDTETLRLYLVAGKPEGSYLNSIKVLTDLYTTYKDDLSNITVTEYGTKLGDLYRTMILALSLTESGSVYLWIDGVSYSDALTRYQIYKDLHLHKGQEAELIENKVFESLTVEEMRWVMNTVIDDEEIVWLNDYVRNKGEGKISPYNYITYTFDYDYSLDKYYSEENYALWDEKYHLSEYNITYEKGRPKLWVVFEEGSVCGGLSKTGSCIWGAYKGLPNTCISQPAHCAYIYYTQDENGNGIWNLGNNVSGWGQSGKTEHLNVRPMNDWGVGSYTTGWNANYILLAQAAQNEYDKYENAEKILMLADVYQNNSTKLEEIYRKAIETEELNFDAWLGLVYLYENDEAKTEADYYTLAEEITKAFTYYPYPMNDLLNLIKPHLTSVEYETKFTLLQTRALTAAANATDKESIQAMAVNQVANQLLGNIDTDIASFSFDGENAGKIILSDRFDGTDVAWEYSLDDQKNWILTEEREVQLTAEELASITADKDIKVHIVGVDYSEENIFTIDIQASAGLPSNMYANDWENKLIGAIDTMQWKYEADDDWISYGTAEPNLSGNKSITVRAGATGLYLAATESKTYSFTEEGTADDETYVSIEKLSIYGFSSEQNGSDNAANVIDGNINTIWHTLHNASDTERWITIKIAEPIYLSALQYVPRQSGTNGRTKNAVLYISMDGETWTEAASASDWENNADAKMLKLTESMRAQYVKFVTTENWGDGRSFASAAMLNLFEDVTKQEPVDGEKDDTSKEPADGGKDDTTITDKEDKEDNKKDEKECKHTDSVTTIKKATVKKNGSVITKCGECGEKNIAESYTIYRPKSMKLSKTSAVYTGKAIRPTVTIIDKAGKKIHKKHYTVTYKNNKNVGKATVIVTFKGKYYSGKITKTFTIHPPKMSIRTIKAVGNKLTVSWKAQTKQVTGYQIQYAANKNFKKAKSIWVKNYKIKNTKISKLKKKTKYYVRIRSYKTVKVNGKTQKLYSAWSSKKTVTTK